MCSMIYQPENDYIPVHQQIRLAEFRDYAEDYVLRPPYQRKTVWSKKQKQQLIDSLLKGHYIPSLVLREISLENKGKRGIRREVIDGQQRITALLDFMNGDFAVSDSAAADIAGCRYKKLPTEVRRFFDGFNLSATLIKGIGDKNNPKHQKIATDIFWRLQQGVSLKQIEVDHASITSRVRNFLVKYADDVSFDYQGYQALDKNPHKHKFFELLSGGNNRMQHLALLGRLLLIECAGGYTDIKDEPLTDLVEETVVDSVNDLSYEKEKAAADLLSLLNKFYEVFEDDAVIRGGGSYQWPEYLTISFCLLVRHISRHYAWEGAKKHLREFLLEFHGRWKSPSPQDPNIRDIHAFRDDRQQAASDLRNRDLILRQLFFDFLPKGNGDGDGLCPLDSNRLFSEADRIKIYRDGNGLCAKCQEEGKPEKECRVPWNEYEADHIIPWIKGGQTTPDNGQVLCRTHNRAKGGR